MSSVMLEINRKNHIILHGAEILAAYRKASSKALASGDVKERMDALQLSGKNEEFSTMLRRFYDTQIENEIRQRIWEKVDKIEEQK